MATLSWNKDNLPANLGKRVAAILLIGSCLGLALWSVTIRLSLVTQAQSTMHSPFSVMRELETLKTTWAPERVEHLTRDWTQFQSRNFKNYDQVVGWISRYSGRAETLGFQVGYRVGEEGQPIAGVPGIKPLTIELSLQTKTAQDGYRNFIQFLKEVSDSDIAVTLDKIDLIGTGRGVQKLEVVLQAFMNESGQ